VLRVSSSYTYPLKDMFVMDYFLCCISLFYFASIIHSILSWSFLFLECPTFLMESPPVVPPSAHRTLDSRADLVHRFNLPTLCFSGATLYFSLA
jgi:hypothetical protein